MSMSRQQRRELERKQRKADRREMNSQPSTAVTTGPTGPRTEAGKAISAQNALRHGLTASRLVLPWENKDEYDHLLAQLMAEHNPQSAIETIFVNEMAENWWRLGRARNSEYDSILDAKKLQLSGASEEQFKAWDKRHSVIRRYLTSYERAFHRAHNTLRKIQKERIVSEQNASQSTTTPDKQFVSQNPPAVAAPSPDKQFVSQYTPSVAAPLPAPEFVSQKPRITYSRAHSEYRRVPGTERRLTMFFFVPRVNSSSQNRAVK